MVQEQRKIRAIIFDLDGVLINVYDRYYLSYTKSFEKEGISVKIDKDYVINRRRKGMSGLQIIKEIARDKKEELLVKVDALRKNIVNEDQLLDMDCPIEGVDHFLENLKMDGLILVILSLRQSVKSVEKQLEKYSLLRYFDKIVVKQNGNCVEEKYDGLIEILDRYGLRPSETILVGDTDCDIRAGHRANLNVIGVLSGLSDRAFLEKEGADIILDNVTKLKV